MNSSLYILHKRIHFSLFINDRYLVDTDSCSFRFFDVLILLIPHFNYDVQFQFSWLYPLFSLTSSCRKCIFHYFNQTPRDWTETSFFYLGWIFPSLSSSIYLIIYKSIIIEALFSHSLFSENQYRLFVSLNSNSSLINIYQIYPKNKYNNSHHYCGIFSLKQS